jgi:hypothetical protein
MPRKAKVIDDKTINVKKKNLLNTMVKDVSIIDNEDVILQLHISDFQMSKMNETVDNEILENPEPYEPNCFYLNETNTYNNIQDNIINEHNQSTDNGTLSNKEYNENIIHTYNNCYWCCHPINNRTYGMPYKYNVKTDTYILFGNFCSLECANAYNFSSHCGSYKVWEINSLIQMLSKHFGISHPVRPAPSRFLLKIFNGPMTIEEFRSGHLTNDKTHLLNLPPMILTNYNYEIVNTSYLKNITDNMHIKNENGKDKLQFANNNISKNINPFFNKK